MSKSIIQEQSGGECYLCDLFLGIDTPAPIREEHHVMHGTANRRLAEHYGLKVYLCPYHHRSGPQAAAGGRPAATCKNQQNEPFSQISISQNTPPGFCFLRQDPRKEAPEDNE